MKLLIGTTAILGLLSTAAHADTVALIDNLENHGNEQVTVSGVVSWIEDENEFTLADNTGDIEVNLQAAREDLSPGDFVTVSGVVDTTLLDELDAATVTVASADYDNWNSNYYSTYGSYYDLNGFDTNFSDTVDWDNDIYDDYWATY